MSRFIKFLDLLFTYYEKSEPICYLNNSSFAGGRWNRVPCYTEIASPSSHGFGGQAGERSDLIGADFC